MQKIFYKKNTRGVSEHGWLSSRFSFSFADYYNPDRMGFGALRVLNDDKIAADNGFGMHEHKNMEIISIPLEGELIHKDSLGNELVIGPDEVQVMSAGSGVTHSEINPSMDVEGQFLQIWIQTRENDIDPAHGNATFPAGNQLGKFVTLVKPDTVEGEALSIHADAYISRGRFAEGQEGTYDIQIQGNGAFIFIIEGSATIDGQPLETRDALSVSETSTITITPTSPEFTDILIIEVPME